MPRRERQVKRSDGFEDRDYEVELILESRIRDGQTWYLIKWKGFDDTWNSWEPLHLLNCPDKLKEFDDRKLELADKSRERKPIITLKASKAVTAKAVTSKAVVGSSVRSKVDDDVEVLEFAIIEKTEEAAVLFKINNQFELIPYKAARGQHKFHDPLIDFFERHLEFHENETKTEILINI